MREKFKITLSKTADERYTIDYRMKGSLMRRIVNGLTSALVLVLCAAPARADVDLPMLVAVCKMGQCQNALQSTMRRLQREGLEPDAWNTEIGYIALALFESARDSGDTQTRSRVANALVDLAGYSTEADQQGALLSVAEAIADGDAALWDVDDPFSASPS